VLVLRNKNSLPNVNHHSLCGSTENQDCFFIKKGSNGPKLCFNPHFKLYLFRERKILEILVQQEDPYTLLPAMGTTLKVPEALSRTPRA
jgi:hypothetical protein